jgi:hypothetical protein
MMIDWEEKIWNRDNVLTLAVHQRGEDWPLLHPSISGTGPVCGERRT